MGKREERGTGTNRVRVPEPTAFRDLCLSLFPTAFPPYLVFPLASAWAHAAPAETRSLEAPIGGEAAWNDGSRVARFACFLCAAARGKLRALMSEERQSGTEADEVGEKSSGESDATAPGGSPGDAQAAPVGPVRESAMRSFVGLFIVPLLVVLVCVGVFVGFGWIAYDQQTTGDYLNDLKSNWRPRRAQAAYELAKILIADPSSLDQDPVAKAEIRRLFAESDDDEMTRYLALVLGRTRDPKAVPLLADKLDHPSSEQRIYALMALGSTGQPSAVEPVAGALSDADPGIRKTAAYALGELGERSAVPPLRGRLEDSEADVRWNAAVALARLGDDSGVVVLRRMLDRERTGRVPGITPEQQEEAMISAVRALAVVAPLDSKELFDRLAGGDPSLKVRQAAIEAQRAVAAVEEGGVQGSVRMAEEGAPENG